MHSPWAEGKSEYIMENWISASGSELLLCVIRSRYSLGTHLKNMQWSHKRDQIYETTDNSKHYNQPNAEFWSKYLIFIY